MTVSHTRPSLIVGVGASAGGIQAFQQFLSGVPEDTDAAIVLVMHLDPERPSGLASALAPSTPLPVVEARDGMAIEPGHVYVIGSNSTLTMREGRLHSVSPRLSSARRETIDMFLASLAADAGTRAVGVILSGTAADGAVGMMAIKAAGGCTFAQDDSAQFESMPQAAADTGTVDRVLPPEKIMAAVLELTGAGRVFDAREEDPSALAPVLERLLRESDIDFGRYKPAMLGRRVRRRMALSGVPDLAAYIEMLDEQPEELHALLQDVLINVTAFFRDPKSFDALREHAFPDIVAAGTGPIRIWVPGCSTGEEAYSLAIALFEFLQEEGIERQVQVFATDVDEPAIAAARSGVFPEAVINQLGPTRARFFARRQDGNYETKRKLRDACIFARHDVTGDPPFSKLDLISCRNVLIYLSADIQRQLMPVFHYALRDGGFLSLGPAEGVGGMRDLFSEVAPRTHLFRRKAGPPMRPPEGYPFNRPGGRGPVTITAPPPLVALQDEVDRVRLDVHAPPAIIVDERDRVLLICGDVSEFVRPGPGRPDTTAAKMVRDDLHADFESALTEARAQQSRVRREGLVYETKEGPRSVTLDIIPLDGAHGPVHLVTFAPAPAPPMPAAPLVQGEAAETERLRSALFAQKLHHNVVIRRLEAANEELRNTQEEFLASNEEFQSTNEELETAKEELQSSYEELTTVNDQLRVHTAELTALYADLENIVEALAVPLLILDAKLAIRRVADPGELIISAVPADIGRSLADLHVNIQGIDLPAMAKAAMRTGKVQQEETQDRDGRWQELRVRPYVTADDPKAGVVVVLLDVHAQKAEALAHERARTLADTIIETTPTPMLLLDAKLNVLHANAAFLRTFECDESSVRGVPLFKIDKKRWNIPALRTLIDTAVHRPGKAIEAEVEHPLRGLGTRTLRLGAATIPEEEGRADMVLLTLVDETTHRQAERDLDALRVEQLDHLVQLNRFKAEFIGMAAHELAGPLTPMPVQLKVLEKNALDESQANAVASIKRNLATITLLVKDMLVAARFQSGRLEIEKQRLDVAHLVKTVCDDFSGLMAEKGIQLKVALEAVHVLGDPHHIERVVINLLSNALKYTEEGGRVDVTLARQGDDAVLSVKDTGIGLPTGALEDIFQPFRRLEAGKDAAPGTGLGLYICNGIVHLHGGTLTAASPGPGKGSTFTVTLPLGTTGAEPTDEA